MKNLIFVLGLLVSGVAAAEDRVISVYGDSEFTACPTGAIIVLSVSNGGPTTKEVFDANNKAINQIFTAVKAVGIESSDIKTSQFTIAPRYRVVNNESVFAGYQATNQVMITINKVDGVSPVIDAATEAGASQVSAVEFTYGDLSERTQKAKLEALTEAKAKAEEMLATLGAKLGKVRGLSDQPAQSSGRLQSMMRSATADGYGESAGSAIASGDKKFVIQMHVSFEIID